MQITQLINPYRNHQGAARFDWPLTDGPVENVPHWACPSGSRVFARLKFIKNLGSAETREPPAQGRWGELQQALMVAARLT